MDSEDFYSGFEGEPELRFVLCLHEAPVAEIRAWNGYFAGLMQEVPRVNGQWTGLALPYHLAEGWYETSPWTIPDVREVEAQWRAIPVAKVSDPAARAFHAALLALLGRAVAERGSVQVFDE